MNENEMLQKLPNLTKDMMTTILLLFLGIGPAVIGCKINMCHSYNALCSVFKRTHQSNSSIEKVKLKPSRAGRYAKSNNEQQSNVNIYYYIISLYIVIPFSN